MSNSKRQDRDGESLIKAKISVDPRHFRLSVFLSSVSYDVPARTGGSWPLQLFFLGVSKQFRFYKVGLSAPRPTPQQCWRTDGLLLRLVFHRQPAVMEGPTGNHTTASTTW